MKLQQLLRQENFRLKNQITDLKNGFDMNRDFLKLLSNHDYSSDPQHNLLFSVINRLTSINNTIMLNMIQISQQRGAMKQEIIHLRAQVLQLQQKLIREVKLSRGATSPLQYKIKIQQQFKDMNKDMLAVCEEGIIKGQQIQFWKQRFIRLQNGQQDFFFGELEPSKNIERRYNIETPVKYEIINRELEKQIRRLKLHIEEIEARLLIFIKAHNLQQPLYHKKKLKQKKHPFFEVEQEQIKLLKYACNDMKVYEKDNQMYMTIVRRFQDDVPMKRRRKNSWPKNKQDYIYKKQIQQ